MHMMLFPDRPSDGEGRKKREKCPVVLMRGRRCGWECHGFAPEGAAVCAGVDGHGIMVYTLIPHYKAKYLDQPSF